MVSQSPRARDQASTLPKRPRSEPKLTAISARQSACEADVRICRGLRDDLIHTSRRSICAKWSASEALVNRRPSTGSVSERRTAHEREAARRHPDETIKPSGFATEAQEGVADASGRRPARACGSESAATLIRMLRQRGRSRVEFRVRRSATMLRRSPRRQKQPMACIPCSRAARWIEQSQPMPG